MGSQSPEKIVIHSRRTRPDPEYGVCRMVRKKADAQNYRHQQKDDPPDLFADRRRRFANFIAAFRFLAQSDPVFACIRGYSATKSPGHKGYRSNLLIPQQETDSSNKTTGRNPLSDNVIIFLRVFVSSWRNRCYTGIMIGKIRGLLSIIL